MGNSLTNKCIGTITRKRITAVGVEESIVDFILMSRDMEQYLMNIQIDEERKHVMTKVTRTKQSVNVKESDHNTILSRFELKWKGKNKKFSERNTAKKALLEIISP